MSNKKLFNSLSFKIKLTVSAALAFLLALSFFFAPKIESALGLRSQTASNIATMAELESSAFSVEYIDVGQGNSTFIRFPDGKTALIDGGDAAAGDVVTNFLHSRSVEQLDYLVATHADADHIGGLLSVLENFEVKTIVRPFQIAGFGTSEANFVVSPSEELGEVYSLLTENNFKVTRVTSPSYISFIEKVYSETYSLNGERFSADVTDFYDGLRFAGTNYSMEFFYPEKLDVSFSLNDYSTTSGYATKSYGATDTNNGSAIILIEILGKSFFFSGDAAFDDEGSSLEEQDFVSSLSVEERQRLSRVSVYLVGHHGSSTSSGSALLSLLQPNYCVISCAKVNDYGHPAPSTVSRLLGFTPSEKILQTSEHGTISFGEVGDALVCSCGAVQSRPTISWYVLGSIIFCAIEIILISVRPVSRRQTC